MRFEIYKSNSLLGGAWRWRLLGVNSEPIASGEGYHRREDCMHAISLIQSTNALTPIYETAI